MDLQTSKIELAKFILSIESAELIEQIRNIILKE